MSTEAPRPSDIRNEVLTFQEAETVLWGTGNIALGNATVTQKSLIADELGKMFDKVDQASKDTAIAAPLSESETPKVTIASILEDVDAQTEEIYDREGVRDELGIVNILDIKDERLPALMGLRLYIDLAYHEMRDEQRSMN